MEKIGFIGATDKTNLIMYVAKVLEIMGRKVIVVDTTAQQKIKYMAPAINPTKKYITNFENIDFAVGFDSIEDLKNYIGVEENILNYDYMLIDIDNYSAIEKFEIESEKNNYFVTSFDMYSLRKGIEILKRIQEPMNLTKILTDYSISEEDEEYLDFLSVDAKVNWSGTSIYMPVTGPDRQIMEENQRISRIKFKRLSGDYIEAILYIIHDLIMDINVNKIKKMIKE